MVISFDTGKIETTSGGETTVNLQQKKVIVTENGLDVIIPDAGYDGLSTVYVKTYVSDNDGLKDFSVLGYSEEEVIALNEKIDNDIEISKSANEKTCVYLPMTALNKSFNGWLNLQYIPEGYNIGVINFMSFEKCTSLKEIDFNKINVTITGSSVNSLFNGCTSLNNVHFRKNMFTQPLDAQYMFGYTFSLNELDFTDVGFKPTNMSYFCQNSNVKTVKGLDTSLCTKFNYAFQNTIGGGVINLCKLSLSSLTSCTSANIGYCLYLSLVNFGGFVDCEQITDWGTYSSNPFNNTSNLEVIEEMGTIKGKNFNLSSSTKLTVDSLMVVINALYDYVGNGDSTTQTCTLGSTNLAKLSDVQKAIATAKGWILK